MALSILDGNQSATTLSTILSSGQHITAHTVVSLGTQAKTDILSAVSSGIAISGTVTANVFGKNANSTATLQIPLIAYDEGIQSATDPFVIPVQVTNGGGQISGANPLPISGTVTANVNGVPNDNGIPYFGVGYFASPGSSLIQVSQDPNCGLPINGTVTIGSALPAGTNRIGVVTIGGGSVTIGAGTAQIGSVTVGNSVTIGSLPAISGTVTANSSNGSLTTRFGSVTTANTAFATSAVTNANRKYLLIQNITTASNVITVGIGFTPTTTQGILLSSGAGITFDGNYIPTGAVNLLSSVTASCFTILEA